MQLATIVVANCVFINYSNHFIIRVVAGYRELKTCLSLCFRDKFKRPKASKLLQHTFVTERQPCLAETEKVTANFVEVSQ